MPRERIEVGVERLHVDRHVRHALRTIDDDNDVAPVRLGDDFLERQHGAERVRYVCDREDLDRIVQQRIQPVERQVTVLIDRRHDEFRAGLLADELPRHDVGMVFEVRDQHLAAFTQSRPGVSLRDEVDCFGRAARQHDFAA